MKKYILLILLFPAAVLASPDFGNDGGQSGVVSGLTVNDNTVIGSGTEDSVTINADAISIPNDTVITLGGGASGLTITGDVILASMSVVDAYNTSFGSITAGSTSTLTWTEVTDRLGEFVTSSFTVLTAGYYEFIPTAAVSQTAGSACLIYKVNGTSPAGGTFCNTGVTALLSVLPLSYPRILNLAANDVVRIDGSATTANGTFQTMSLIVKRVP